MRATELTANELLDYCREDDQSPQNIIFITQLKNAALAFIRGYTGQTNEYIDEHDDFVPVVYTLVADAYEIRQLTVENGKDNPFVMQILAMHSINLI